MARASKTVMAQGKYQIDFLHSTLDAVNPNVAECQENLGLRDYSFIFITRQIEERMDELARKYVETRDKKIVEELYELARELEK
jgi:vacuolar-type H+-ATPase subunit F/Vma7